MILKSKVSIFIWRGGYYLRAVINGGNTVLSKKFQGHLLMYFLTFSNLFFDHELAQVVLGFTLPRNIEFFFLKACDACKIYL